MRHSFSVGPAVKGLDQPVNQMLWVLLEVDGQPMRVGELFYGKISLNRKAIQACEAKWHGRFLGYLIEPCYDHNGYYDPPGWASTEAKHRRFMAGHAKKIGKLPHFRICPKCKAGHTAATVSCRKCGYTSR